ncbi:hypothetical protein OG618_18425 [Kitasatospora sp. NBC_01246]|uniref:hypothetical protein n=1 Tax=Kitasatospora sp. NBC_01246 TaxID=2903570 RepID=UPI002E330747|nr:hypothetical protein [Kitasatospora sp. NBC_01246]
MSNSDTAAVVRPSRGEVALVRGAWGVGTLTVVASVLLIVGAFAADSAAGETGQPAGVLGAIGLFVGGTILAVGLLARSVVARSGRQ